MRDKLLEKYLKGLSGKYIELTQDMLNEARLDPTKSLDDLIKKDAEEKGCDCLRAILDTMESIPEDEEFPDQALQLNLGLQMFLKEMLIDFHEIESGEQKHWATQVFEDIVNGDLAPDLISTAKQFCLAVRNETYEVKYQLTMPK